MITKDIPIHIESIMVALLSGSATQEEVEKLKQWIDKSPSHMAIWEYYRSTHRMLRTYQQNQRYPAVSSWENTEPKSERKYNLFFSQIDRLQRHFHKWRKIYQGVAVITAAFAIGMALMYFLTRNGKAHAPNSVTEYAVPYGAKAKVTLPDYTVVWLNSGSTLRYGSSYNKTNREVYVEGEAYFQVARNTNMPFQVKTASLSLKVLGTNFNLKAYPDETDIEVTVVSGLVQVLNSKKIRQMGDLVLRPNQKATVEKTTDDQNESDVTVSDDVDTELYTCWKDKRWRIENESLASLAVKLGRRYNVQISTADEQVKNYLFTGTLENTTLEQVLESIRLSAPFNYQIQGDQVILTYKHNKQGR